MAETFQEYWGHTEASGLPTEIQPQREVFYI